MLECVRCGFRASLMRILDVVKEEHVCDPCWAHEKRERKRVEQTEMLIDA